MPADSDRDHAAPDVDGLGPTLPHTWRPLGVRIMAWALSICFGVVFAFAWFTLSPEVRAEFKLRHFITLVLLVAGGWATLYAVVRCKVTAYRDKVVIVNGYRRREYAWAQVVAVSMPPGAPWVTLDLSDGSSVGALAIQGADGRRAVEAVQQLRALATELTR
ncbi:PH domain-containing protein [Nocardioides sp. GY 10127]|uniref:PH domain-containing protein n=1 Tax=Nocardioides sp. GY 10127 TaxID=2569762 RepID=UPI0010A7CAF3|nr:PH domain-containing protein [Nocardioides sp. GY 10127]TIC78695.1 PH domain-containing protein [Nocardioides sp. GY 10127]TIC81043.1 PH domain-containing protein [Nocardioides sp. GY 10127]